MNTKNEKGRSDAAQDSSYDGTLSDGAADVKHARARLTPRHGFFKLWRADVARIRELGECETISVSVAVLIAVWSALSDIANENRSTTFEASIGIIRTRAGVSRRTAFDALKVLESHLKMVSHQRQKPAEKLNPGEFFDANIWNIFPSEKASSANGALGKRRTRGSAKEVPHLSHKGMKNTPVGSNKEESKEPVLTGFAAGGQQADAGSKELPKWKGTF